MNNDSSLAPSKSTHSLTQVPATHEFPKLLSTQNCAEVQVVGLQTDVAPEAPVQLNPCSTIHVALHPSPSTVAPSSHSSVPPRAVLSKNPFPQENARVISLFISNSLNSRGTMRTSSSSPSNVPIRHVPVSAVKLC